MRVGCVSRTEGAAAAAAGGARMRSGAWRRVCGREGADVRSSEWSSSETATAQEHSIFVRSHLNLHVTPPARQHITADVSRSISRNFSDLLILVKLGISQPYH